MEGDFEGDFEVDFKKDLEETSFLQNTKPAYLTSLMDEFDNNIPIT